ncbi:MAG: DUF5702 domain-containing protein [Lachnospiraceae bacterium]|nr:DUF5702 domain-containing protein [Lachnospiraceae bacterium]
MPSERSGSVPARKTEGSITVFLSLFSVILVSLIASAFVSVKVEAGKARCALAMDLALFSGLARYDRELFEAFDVFFVDGGCESPALRMDVLNRRLKEDFLVNLCPAEGAASVFGRDLLRLETEQAAVTGYTLATDAEGEIFAEQAVTYMRDTLGVQGLSELMDAASKEREEGKKKTEPQETAKEGAYETLLAEAESAKKEGEAEKGEVPPDFVNPIPFMEKLREFSLTELAAGGAEKISPGVMEDGRLLKNRKAETGMGIIELPEAAGGAERKALFAQYGMRHFKNFVSAESGKAEGLSYEAEYLAGGKLSDRKNLEKVARKLLAVREAVNTASLLADPDKQLKITAVSASVASLLLLPAAEPVLRLILSGGWAYAESLVDIRALFSGKRVPAVKDASSWQVPLEAIPSLLGEGAIDLLGRDAEGGMSYGDYMRAFLLLTDRKKLTQRSLEMVECRLRDGGKENFRIDHAVSSLTFEVKVKSERRALLREERTLSYSDL